MNIKPRLRTKIIGALFAVLFALFGSKATVFAAANIEIAIDSSGSMNAKIGNESRMDIAKRTVEEVFGDLDANITLRAFGHTYDNTEADKPKSCLDTEILVDFTNDSSKIKTALDQLKPSGWTPLAYTISKAGEELKRFSDQGPVLIVLSDGLDSCGGDPVAEAKKLIDAGMDVTIHVIGFAVDTQTEASLKALATAGNGNYYSAGNATELAASFEQIVKVEEVPAKAASDVINTTGAENKIVGGSTYEDTKPFPTELFGKEVSLTKHLLPGAFETFSFEVKEGQQLQVKILTGEKGVAKNKEGVTEVSDRYSPWSMVTFYTDRKVKIDAVRTYAKAFTELDDTVRFTNAGTVFFFIGAEEKLSNYGIPQDTIYTFTLTDKAGNPVYGSNEPGTSESATGANDSSNSIANAVGDKVDNNRTIDGLIGFIEKAVIGGILVVVVIVAAILFFRKKKTTK